MNPSALVMGALLAAAPHLALTDDVDSRAKDRLAEFETQLNAARTAEERFELLPLVAGYAVRTGDLEKALSYSDEALRLAESYQSSWAYGNALHRGHLVRGHVALSRGDVQRAVTELLAAGATPGSPQLDSFGPNMALAKALLERGQRKAVLSYLDQCRTFWKMSDGKLDTWKAQIEKGEAPDFGANLVY